MRFHVDHAYTSFTKQIVAINSESVATGDSSQRHPNKWLACEPTDNSKQPQPKKDPILFQPKADALNIVRVKFRAPIVERGKDPHFGSLTSNRGKVNLRKKSALSSLDA